ncbi:uncharacterized protein [Primulina eburnea]|uniref:uncharacterized protein n=1 Tax=Primulina eburnea TaxID=1245227 RepID=UPI003C6C06F8
MAPYEALYGRKCRSPLYWDEVGEKVVTGPELFQLTIHKAAIIKERLKTAQDRQKSWADLEKTGVARFSKSGKLNPRYVGPFEILEKLRKYVSNPSHVLKVAPLMIEGNLNEELKYEEVPIRIVGTKDQMLRHRTIPYVQVQWSNHTKREATGELEEKIRAQYPHLFVRSS